MNFIKELLKLREDDQEVSAADLKVDDEVHSKLDRAAKEDEVDAQCFGLEMEDGKVVKVYVKQEDAEEFEKALSAKLGEDDDIQAALDELGKDFEIVEVVWPDEDDSDDEPNEDDPDKEEEDGSDALNKEVDYDDTKEESLTLGQRFAKKLTELKWSADENDEFAKASKAAPEEKPQDDEAAPEDAPQEPEAKKVVDAESKWKIEKDEDGGMVISNDRFKMELDSDEAMDLVNKIADKQVARFKDEHGKIVYVFTPRGAEYILKTPEFQGGFRIPMKVLDQIKEENSGEA